MPDARAWWSRERVELVVTAIERDLATAGSRFAVRIQDTSPRDREVGRLLQDAMARLTSVRRPR